MSRESYERNGRAVHGFLSGAGRNAVLRLAEELGASSAWANTLDQWVRSYRRSRELWAAGSHAAAAQLMASTATSMTRALRDLQTLASSRPTLARLASALGYGAAYRAFVTGTDATVRATADAGRAVVSAAAGLGTGALLLGLGVLALVLGGGRRR